MDQELTSGPASWSTDAVPAAERLPAWSALVSSYFGPIKVRYDGPTDFRAELHAVTLGSLRLFEIRGVGHQLVRRIDADRRGPAVVNIQLAGWSMAGGSQTAFTTAAGRIGLISAPWPVIVELPDDFHQLLITLPCELLEARLVDGETAYGQVLADEANAALIINRAAHLVRRGGGLDPSTARLVGDQLADLIVHAYAQQVAATDSRPRFLLHGILAEIDRRHHEPTLAAADVAAQLGISVRYLQRLLAGHGTTFGRRLVDCRVEHCRDELEAGTEQPIAAIALRHGFVDPARFSKAFRARLGTSPRAYRAAGPTARPQPGAGITARVSPDSVGSRRVRR